MDDALSVPQSEQTHGRGFPPDYRRLEYTLTVRNGVTNNQRLDPPRIAFSDFKARKSEEGFVKCNQGSHHKPFMLGLSVT